MSDVAAAYQKHMNLKLAASELGIPWQTLYVKLRQLGVAVVGDKARYGSDRDRLAVMAEQEFQRLVPMATNANAINYQAKFDFTVGAIKVDVKASLPARGDQRFAATRWAFSIKKQTLICDFICCFCMNADKTVAKVLLVPKEFFAGLQSVSVPCAGRSKWLDYEVKPEELAPFFAEVAQASSIFLT